MIWNKDNIDKCLCLEKGDYIEFNIDIRYSVEHSFLDNCNGSNHVIFEYAGIKNDKTFCEEAYGYEPHDGVFPESNIGDYNALTRVTKAIFHVLYPKTASGLIFTPISSIKIVL